MKISSLDNSRTINTSATSFKGPPVYLKEPVCELGRKVYDYIKVPENKLFMAITALMFQPLVDLLIADEDKRTDASIKSASKAIAGGITGVTIRGVFLNIAESCIGLKKNNVINDLFLPKEAIELAKTKPGEAIQKIKEYNSTLSSIFAILLMIGFTNANIDVPLTSDFQDLIGGIAKENKTFIKSLSDVYKSRKGKIVNWLNKLKNKVLKLTKPARKKSVEVLNNIEKQEEQNK